ncbi:MAG: sulfite oxidase-like oxidoreductase [Phycisphaerales bacterium]|nr:sulfite oxidase-like oxidoreductase [Phycisphaerales bacterium]|tara:strand:- start:6143 stop:6778 length:636 start_codon:yes stop_codon:yes gene_type:complete
MSQSCIRPLIVSPDTLRGDGDQAARTPPGQSLTSKWPVLHFGEVPDLQKRSWKLVIDGLCKNPLVLDWDSFMQLPQVEVACDIHCVTRWSRLDNRFIGVSTRAIIDLVEPSSEAKYVIQHADSDPDGKWTTNLPLHAFTSEDCLLAWSHDGSPLTPDHGGPVRTIVPQRYSWKGAKWIRRIELAAEDRPGFWELNGYHNEGNPWLEERSGW